jgi:hypothetical protein
MPLAWLAGIAFASGRPEWQTGIAKLVIGAALVIAIVCSIALTTTHKSNDDVAFLERLASTVERAKALAPDTRDYVSQVTSRYKTQLSDTQLELRRQKALARIMAVAQPAGSIR